jgi:uncharacterized SAM-dependent methyltransferase
MTKLEITKVAAKFIVGSGTATIVRAIIKNNVQPDDIATKVTVTAGSIVLGSMVADLAARYTDAKIDAIATWYDENVKKP